MKRLPLLLFVFVVGACSSASGLDAVVTPGTDDSTTTTVAVTTTTVREPTTTTAPAPTTTTIAPSAPPTLTTSIGHGEVVTTYQQELTGEVTPGATVTVDGEPVTVAADGSWAAGPWLNTLGTNAVVVVATAADGTTSTTRRITYTFAPEPGWVAAIGDSVMLGTAPEIEKRLGEGIVDATVSRQFSAAPELVAALMARAEPPQLIIIGLGTNGPAQDRYFDAVMELAADVPLVAFVNVRVPRSWEATSNEVLAAGVERYDNAVLVDWYGAAADRDDLFAADGVHPKQPGRVILAELIADAVFPNWVPYEEE